MGSKRFQLCAEDGRKIGSGTAIAAAAAIVGYLVERQIPDLPQEIHAAVFIVACTLITLLVQWASDSSTIRWKN